MKFIFYYFINGLASSDFGADVCIDFTPCKSLLREFQANWLATNRTLKQANSIGNKFLASTIFGLETQNQ
jgi:hypothetical protein